jgi:hypothetical protein
VAIVGLLLLVTCVSARALGDFDLPAHMATGRLIWQSGHIPRVDDLSYLHGSIRYIELLSVSLFYGAFRLGGLLGVQLLGGIAAAGIAVSLWAQTRRFGPASLVCTALALASASTFLVVRSSALSFPLLALALLVLDGHRRAVRARGVGGPRITRRWLGAYVGLAFVWANVHGSVTLGLLLGLTYLGHVVACRLARGRAGALLPQSDGQDALEVGVAVLLAVAAASVNTGGPEVLLGPLRYGGQVHMLGAFSEWAQPTWALLRDHEPLVPVMLALAVLAGAFGRDAESGERVPALFDVLLVLLAFACALTAVRLLPMAMILLAPWIARRAGRSGESARAAWLACAGSTLLVSARVLSAPLPLGVGFDTSHLPEGAVRWIETHHPIDDMWNTPPFGGYLAWRLYPGVRVLMDGRHALAYELADVSAVDASEQDPAAWASVVQAHHIEWAVTRAFRGTAAGVPLAAAGDWTMVFLDDVAAVYVRGDGPNAALASHGYRVLRHLTSMEQALSLAVRGGPDAGALARDGALAVEQAPGSARSTFFAACGAIALRDGALFGAALEKLNGLAPGDPAIRALMGAWDSAIRQGG